MSKSVLIASASLAVLAVVSNANAGGLNVKPGLWQSTTQAQVSGEIPGLSQADLAKMPPEARARVQGAMKAAAGAMQAPHTVKYCLTQAQIDKGFNWSADQARQNCQNTVQSSSPTEQNIQVVCKSEGETVNGKFHIMALNDTAVMGEFDMTMSGKAQMHIHTKLTSKWLGADCGSIKPGDVDIH